MLADRVRMSKRGIFPPYLYMEGKEGITFEEELYTIDSTVTTFTKENEYMNMDIQQPMAGGLVYGYIGIRTSKKIDITNYNFLNIEWENSLVQGFSIDSFFYLDTEIRENPYQAPTTDVFETGQFSKKVSQLALEGKSGLYYIKILLQIGSSFSAREGALKVYNVWLS